MVSFRQHEDPEWLARDIQDSYRDKPKIPMHPKVAAQNVIKLMGLKDFYTGFHTSDNDKEGEKLIEASAKYAQDTLDNKRMAFKGSESQFFKSYWKAMATDPALEPYRYEINKLFASHVLSDFPLWFKHCREFRLEAKEKACPSQWRQYTRTRTVNNCKVIYPLAFTVQHGLTKQMEIEDLEYTTVVEDQGNAYGVGKYARGLRWSWEMTKCDTIDGLRQILREFGEEARRIEFQLVATAMNDGLSRTPLITNTPAGPVTHMKIKEVKRLKACDTDLCCNLDTIITGTSEEDNVSSIISREYLDFNRGEPNTLRGLRHIKEPELDLYMGGDWVMIDSRKRFLELSVMSEFRGGPLLLFEDSDVRGTQSYGSFSNQSFAVKGLYVGGAGVVKDDCVVRVEGSGGCV